ncbi:hypothetical protein K443DRAFT_673096 [Laccaria amethystina LaAM-08-1]|uniref:Uncharacterized protein n=1 Tax=Laccaria amethystina LaAM-08-1 TaxID=1095629 RepID=A0A0C9Y1R7_9AGAR|nr:hypothetical protein K443DRAFT_673096 [Laccaria amethystina LaAM-08-1]
MVFNGPLRAMGLSNTKRYSLLAISVISRPVAPGELGDTVTINELCVAISAVSAVQARLKPGRVKTLR